MVRILFALLALGGVAGTAFGFLGNLHPAFDTVAHFRWHFALLLLVLAIGGLLLKIRRAPMILLLFATLGVWQSGAGNRIEPLQTAVEAKTGNAQMLELLHFNLRFDNPQKDKVIAMLRSVDADIMTLNETSREWMPKLETLKDAWPHSFHCPEWNVIGGSMIFSKLPLISEEDYCHSYGALGMTRIKASEGFEFEIGAVHMRWPWPASGPEQLVALEPKLKSVGKNALIVGDFNAATWSYAVTHFASLADMNIERGFGGTWIYKLLPSSLAPFFGLPIDNAMAKGDVLIRRARSLPAIGSDHLPLLLEIAVPN